MFYPKEKLLDCLISIKTAYATEQLRNLIPILPEMGYRMLEAICRTLAMRECDVDLLKSIDSFTSGDCLQDPLLVHALARTFKQGHSESTQKAIEFCLERQCSTTAILLVIAFCYSSEDQAPQYASYLAKRYDDIAPYMLREIIFESHLTDLHCCEIAMLLFNEECSKHLAPDEYGFQAYVRGLYLLSMNARHPVVREGISRLILSLTDRDCSGCQEIKVQLEEIINYK